MLTWRNTDRHLLGRASAAALLLSGVLLSRPALASGETVPLNDFDLPPGASVTITFEVDVDSPLGACATAVANQGGLSGANFTSFTTDDPDVVGTANPTQTVLDAVDLAITKTDGSATEVPGTTVTYTIAVTNAGPSAATGATVNDAFPASITGVTWSCVGAGGGTCTAAGVGNISDSVNVPVGGSVTYTATGTIAASATGTLVNTATVAAGGQLECNLANNSATDTDTLTPQVDLAITKTDGLTNINAGAPTTYTITVTNSGPSDAVGASVADTFPAALLSPSWSCVASGGSSCTAGPVAGNLSDIVTVRAGGTLTYTVNATVSGSFSGTLANTATVSAPGGTTDTNSGNNSATDTTNVLPVADLSITKTDGVTTAVPGLSVTYTIVAANAGPATATGAAVSDTFPAACLTISWTCVGAGGGTCTAGPVAGNIADSANLPAGGSATYTAVCTLANNASGSLVNTATISGGGVSDTTPGNNSATDTDTILTLDFGDAPDSSLAAPSGYATLLADNGARHGVTGLKMGTLVDSETDGLPTVNADGDDLNGSDDEDGVTLPSQLVTCENASVTVNASAIAKLDAWVDFNADGDFTDPGEKIFDNFALVAGANNLNFTVPCTATPVPKSFARFRLSTAGGLSSSGVAADGEVEDYAVVIRGLDFGDAPDSPFPTLFASNGARHVVAGSGPILGALIDTEANGQQNSAANGDDTNGLDDEDGVTFTSPLVPGQNANVTVTASAPGVLNAWIDFNADGSFATAGDQIFTNQAVVAGANNLVFAVPAGASSNTATVSRFRVATAGGLSYDGLAADGEVEDHAVATAPVADVSITKTDGSATQIPGTTVTYTITASNAGPDGVNAVAIADTFPAAISGVTWTCVGAGGGTCTAAGAGNLSELVNLPAGGSVTFTAMGTVSASATGSLSNTATATLPVTAFDPNTANNTATDVDTLTPQTDVAVTKTDGAATEIPGTGVTYLVMVTNAGPSQATGVSVTDTFPASLSGCSWISAALGGASGNTVGPVAGNIAETGITMPPGSSITYTATCNIDPAARGSLVNTATVASATTDPTPGNNTATDTDTLDPQIDLTVAKAESADPVVAGSGVGNLTYTITLGNVGPSTATAVTLGEALTLPAGVSVVSVTPSQGSYASPTWTVGTLAPSSNATLTVVLTVGASTAAGTDVICDTASVSGSAEPRINTGNDSATECTSVGRQVDIVVSKVESIDPVIAGSGTGNLTYTVTVHNNGPSDASGITLSEVVTVPAGVTVDTVTPSQGSFASPTWTVGGLASGASATLTVVLTATAAASPGTDVICDTATLTAVSEPQVATGNETATECTSITVSADLAITKNDDADPPPAGSNLTYTISVHNNGPSNATGVVVTDPLPAATTYVSDTCGGSNVPPWTWNIGNLANGATVSCDVVVSINPSPPASISNTATVTATTNDAVPGNNSDTEATTLDAVPPQVTNVDSVNATGGGSLAECETANVQVSELLVTFSEAMATTGAGDVTNAASYELVVPGDDLSFQTTGCGAAGGDDMVLAVGSVTYDGPSHTATLHLGGNLPDSQYRLLVCAALTDVAGNALDGDGNGNGGDDFQRGFRVDARNLLANGYFDCDLGGWTVSQATAGEVAWNSADADVASDSGSAEVTNLMPGIDTTFGLSQCVAVPADARLSTSARVRLQAGAGISINLVRSCELFAAPACASSLGGPSDGFVLQDTGGAWLTLAREVLTPAGAVSARCRYLLDTPAGASFLANLDSISLEVIPEIFADGFETGDTSQWTQCVGTGCPP